MILSRFSKLTTAMIYAGTLCLSVLSFFTTYYGLTILLDERLAFVGSLGLQIALLGLAWNLMKIRVGRSIYFAVFMVAAMFSIFFSYANFDSSLKSYTRSAQMRSSYIDTARPVLTAYAETARQAQLRGRYQVDRLTKLVELEEEKGWATVVDEGSRDPYVQSVLEGARRTVASWNKIEGTDYRQGGGRGIILNYLQSHLVQVQNNLDRIDGYGRYLDSLQLAFGTDQPIDDQYALVNHAWVAFPTSEIEILTSETPSVVPPPNPAEFVESPRSRQQAFQLVITDLMNPDPLALFSLLLAFAIDFIVIIMAFAGSMRMEDVDTLFDRVKQDASHRIRSLRLDDPSEVSQALRSNLDRFRIAGDYDLDMQRFFGEHRNARSRSAITLKRGEEVADNAGGTDGDTEELSFISNEDARALCLRHAADQEQTKS